jgi:hypothetical protein
LVRILVSSFAFESCASVEKCILLRREIFI